ncbi:sensor domain-containing diguanylate cyclase [Shewanella atlantica]|uniref:diguanylate cyclase n=1 Tax=Shewanella atlantica TaxID=271099 RepID=A0A3S0IZW1_9GAMM|nr:diguanylate cyclase [Shewanella atlantica]RTR34983.1 GGDEF domain-containing protein [Shewanella atlantica]
MQRVTLAFVSLFLAILSSLLPVLAAPLDTSNVFKQPIGKELLFLQEQHPLSLNSALSHYQQGDFTASHSNVLSFGIGSNPVWLAFDVDNPLDSQVKRRIQIATSWLDNVDIHFISTHLPYGRAALSQYSGDRSSFIQRHSDDRYFSFDHAFPPGGTKVLIRIESPDPMVLPVYFSSLDVAQQRAHFQNYSYGFLYGAVICLLIYNLMLFIGMRSISYLLYSMFLLSFLLMNLSYTGHGYQWIWPQLPSWQQWANPVFMMLFNVAGLLFALRFLRVKSFLPGTYKLTKLICVLFPFLLLMAFVMGDQVLGLIFAFDFMLLFSFMMILLGVMALKAGNPSSGVFLLASTSSMVGAAVTGMAVWGFIPFNNLTYRAAEIGILIDIVLLALALASKFRATERLKIIAEHQAKTDPLTGLNNRRAFYEITQSFWKQKKSGTGISVIIIDIDYFKVINDTYGHVAGDDVLTQFANRLNKSLRQQDIAARWGGEEFIILLPHTRLKEASTISKRLCESISNHPFTIESNEFQVTASIGLAHGRPDGLTLEHLISLADQQLYRAKKRGKNQISYEQESVA